MSKRRPKPSARSRQPAFVRRTQPGAPPGVLVPDPEAPKPVVTVMAYGPESFTESEIKEVTAIRPLLERWPVTWVNVDGLGDTNLIQELGDLFGLHKLALEDVVHVHQRAKTEQYGDVLFVVAQMPMPGAAWQTEQLSIFFGRNFVVSFQEQPGGDCLESVRLRIRTGMGRMRVSHPDTLVYAMLDAVIDNYFPLLEDCGERLDSVEEAVLARHTRGVMKRLHGIKRDLRMIRRAMWPLRDAVNVLLRDTTPLVTAETRIYLRDCYDHTVQIIDLMENYRDMAAGLTDVYVSTISNNINEVMRVLTVISTIFIPLTFIVGIYGMNFNTAISPWNMPELNWHFGYPAVLMGMALVAGSLLLFFWRRGWIGRGRHSDRGQDGKP